MEARSGSPPSVWTHEALLLHLLRVIADLEAKQSQRAGGQDKAVEAALVAQDKAVQAALVAQEKAVQAALAAADKAVQKAEEVATAWRDSSNEWRSAMSDRERTFINRTEHDKEMEAFSDKLNLLEKYSGEGYGKAAGTAQMWGMISIVVPILVAIAAVVIAIVR